MAEPVVLQAPAAAAPTAGATALPPSPEHLPHGLKGLTPYTFELPLWAVVAAALLLALLLFVILRRWWHKRKGKAQAQVHVEDPLIVLEREIRRLAPPEPFNPGRIQADYYFELSLKLRSYIERTTEITATDRTLKELSEPIRMHAKLRDYAPQVLAFLQRADMVKFGEFLSDVAEARAFHESVLVWVAKLKPEPVPEGTAPPASARDAASVTSKEGASWGT